MTISIKKACFIFITLFFLMGWGSQQTPACQLNIAPADFSATLGETVEFQVDRTQTCGRCILPLENTDIKITGGELVAAPQWKDGNGHPDLLHFKVRFTQPGAVKVVIERICAKNRSAVTAIGLIHPTVSDKKQLAPLPDNPVNSIKPSVPTAPRSIENTSTRQTTEFEPTAPVAAPTPQPTAINADSPVSAVSGPTPITNQTAVVSGVPKQTPSLAFLYPWLLLLPVGLGLFLFKKTWLRRTLLFLSIVAIGFYSGGCPCPVGSVFNCLTPNPPPLLILIVLIIFPLVATLIWGRFFCGWICPLGAAQELIHAKNLGTGAQFSRIDRRLKYLKFLVLILVVYFTFKTGRNVFCQYEPFKMLFSFHGNLVTGVILGLILLTAVVVKRPFCRYLCPFGAILAIIARFSVFKIRLQPASCKGCGVCAKECCPMDAIAMNAINKIPIIDHSECIQCRNCVDNCSRHALKRGQGMVDRGRDGVTV
jgi:NosR/NirI family nitrous oxide reductase transcriptional regulator